MKYLLLGVALVGVVAGHRYFDLTHNNQQATTTCPCGWSNKGRIVGGRESQANAYPFMVAVTLNRGTPFCGASIITNEHVLTAAHCTHDVKDKISELFVLVGGHDFRQATHDQFIPVARTVEHPEYNQKENEANDIAIMVLRRRLIFRNDVGPICLPNRSVNLEGHWVRVMGWGLTQNEGTLSRNLKEADLRVIPYSVCQRFYPGELQQRRSQFCTFKRNEDSCQGDSGGPLMAVDSSTGGATIVGVVSFGRECASESPAVNTDVGFYIPWIRSVVAQTGSANQQICTKIRTSGGTRELNSESQ